MWYFEEEIKVRYARLLQVIEAALKVCCFSWVCGVCEGVWGVGGCPAPLDAVRERETAIGGLKDRFVSVSSARAHSHNDTQQHTRARAQPLQVNIEHFRARILRVVYELLVQRREQERVLVQLLVNEMGDREKKVASAASNYLGMVIKARKDVRAMAVDEVEALLHRPNLGLR